MENKNEKLLQIEDLHIHYMSEGRAYIYVAPWLTICPGVSIVLVVLSLNLFGDGLRDALDPKLKQ